jgi:hypothetical protein
MKVHENGGNIVCGGRDGTVSLIELSSSLSKLQPSEKATTALVWLFARSSRFRWFRVFGLFLLFFLLLKTETLFLLVRKLGMQSQLPAYLAH